MTPADLGRSMQIPATLDAKFTQLISRYPLKRSALVPMMMYAQDYYGFVGDDVLAEIARRLDLNMTQVTETMAYYSMLRRQPMGKYHIQVCTNVSCMLRGGNEMLAHLKKRLSIGHKEVTPFGHFLAGGSRMYGRLHRRAVSPGELRFLRRFDTDSGG